MLTTSKIKSDNERRESHDPLQRLIRCMHKNAECDYLAISNDINESVYAAEDHHVDS